VADPERHSLIHAIKTCEHGEAKRETSRKKSYQLRFCQIIGGEPKNGGKGKGRRSERKKGLEKNLDGWQTGFRFWQNKKNIFGSVPRLLEKGQGAVAPTIRGDRRV